MHSNDREKVVSGLIWKFSDRVVTQGIQFILSIILARILTPHDFGLVALIIIFINIANVFVISGLNIALVQKKEIDDVDCSSALFLSIFIAGALYLLLFLMTPTIAKFYSQPALVSIIRVLALTLFIGAFQTVWSAVLIREMDFKKYFMSTLFGVTGSAIIGITMAYKGFGVWALVFSQLSNSALLTLMLWITVRWRPKLIFSLDRIKALYRFSFNVLLTSLVGIFTDSIYGLAIGKKYSSADLAYYNKGNEFPYFITKNTTMTISTVILPVMAVKQDDVAGLKELLRKSIRLSSFIMFPVMVVLAVVAEPMVRVVLTDKWLPAVFFLQINCIGYFFMSAHTANMQALLAMGRSDITVKLEMTKSLIILVFFFISIPFGIYAMASLRAVASVAMLGINLYPNKRLLNYSFSELLRDIQVPIFMSAVMGGIIYLSMQFFDNKYLAMSIPVLIGIAVYIIMSLIFKISSFFEIFDNLKLLRRRRL